MKRKPDQKSLSAWTLVIDFHKNDDDILREYAQRKYVGGGSIPEWLVHEAAAIKTYRRSSSDWLKGRGRGRPERYALRDRYLALYVLAMRQIDRERKRRQIIGAVARELGMLRPQDLAALERYERRCRGEAERALRGLCKQYGRSRRTFSEIANAALSQVKAHHSAPPERFNHLGGTVRPPDDMMAAARLELSEEGFARLMRITGGKPPTPRQLCREVEFEREGRYPPPDPAYPDE